MRSRRAPGRRFVTATGPGALVPQPSDLDGFSSSLTISPCPTPTQPSDLEASASTSALAWRKDSCVPASVQEPERMSNDSSPRSR